MTANSDNKADLSVDNAHTPFGLTRPSPAKPLQSNNDPNQ